jgi:integrase
VPVAVVLRDYLIAWKLERGGDGLVFGRSADVPFDLSSTGNRAKRAWARAGVQPIGFHEARHTHASLMTAAGVNAKALATFMGHSSITITLDHDGHVMLGNKAEALRSSTRTSSGRTRRRGSPRSRSRCRRVL